jgi:ribose transport system substrate-binding protein
MPMKLALSAIALSLACASPALCRDGDRWVVGMSQCNLGEPWRVQMNADIRRAAAAHPDIEVVYKDAQNDTLRQRAQIEEFVNSNVDLLIVSPKEAAPLTPPIAEAFRRGVPVIVLDRRVLGGDYTEFIGADNRAIGRAAGEWAARRLAGLPAVGKGARARVVELEGLMTSIPAQDRGAGFHEALKGAPADIVYTADMKWLEPQARLEMESALAVQPRIDLVFAHNDPGAHGAYLAAQAAGRERDIIFVGIDGLAQEGQVYVRQGVLAATFEYPTGGREAVDNALRLLRHESVPKEVILRSRFFTPDNIAGGGEWLR